MFTPLLKSERFVNEYERFKQDIALITDDYLKTQLTDELMALRLAVQSMDDLHERLAFGGNYSEEINALRDKIKNLRQSIDTKVRVWRENH